MGSGPNHLDLTSSSALSCFVSVGKLHNLSCFSFLSCKMGLQPHLPPREPYGVNKWTQESTESRAWPSGPSEDHAPVSVASSLSGREHMFPAV